MEYMYIMYYQMYTKYVIQFTLHTYHITYLHSVNNSS